MDVIDMMLAHQLEEGDYIRSVANGIEGQIGTIRDDNVGIFVILIGEDDEHEFHPFEEIEIMGYPYDDDEFIDIEE